MQQNSVVWFEIYVSDMKRAKQFYSTVFQQELKDMQVPEGMDMEMTAFPSNPDGPGAAGALVRMEGFVPGGNGVLVYFHCADCAVEESRVVAAGGQVMRSKFPIGAYGFIAIVTDTEGNAIGLHSMS
jgi:predicted enzyme related to lactoylglutathione lyase